MNFQTLMDDGISYESRTEKSNISTEYNNNIVFRGTYYSSSHGGENTAYYFLNGAYSKFSGTFYLPIDNKNSKYPAVFHIYADGVEVCTSAPIMQGFIPADFSADITGAKILKIYAQYPEGGEHETYPTIANPVLTTAVGGTRLPAAEDLPSDSASDLFKLKMKEKQGTINSRSDLVSNVSTKYRESLTFSREGGYSTSPECSATYTLSSYTKLTGTIFLDQSCKNQDTYTMVLHIYGDGVELFTSDPLTMGSLPQKMNVNVTGVKELKLEVTGGGSSSDYLCLGNPALYN